MRIGPAEIHPGKALFLIAGPCVIEGENEALFIAEEVAKISASLKIPTIFKASFDKANRTAITSFRGPGLEEGLRILEKIKDRTGLPVTSDIHQPDQASPAAEVLDLLQIPAFLCRQTDLLVAAARTGKPVNIKKGQFLAPWDISHAVEKARSAGAEEILLTERGVSFGYNNLVVDMRTFPHLQQTGCPVIFDATHSVQRPAGLGDTTGGDRDMVPVLAKAAVAAGCDGLFFETHPDPDKALSDGSNMLNLKDLKEILSLLIRIRKVW